MDDPQANLRIAKVAGMWLADGFVTAKYHLPSPANRQKTNVLQPCAGYVSKDYDYIEFISQVFTEHGIGHHITERKRHPNRALIWNLNVSGHRRFQAWYAIFGDHLIGRKAKAAQALAGVYNPDMQKLGPGRIKPVWQQERERNAYLLVRKLNSTGASETIITAPPIVGVMG